MVEVMDVVVGIEGTNGIDGRDGTVGKMCNPGRDAKGFKRELGSALTVGVSTGFPLNSGITFWKWMTALLFSAGSNARIMIYSGCVPGLLYVHSC